MKPFTTLTAVIFALMSFVHILRLIFGWEITVSGLTIPMWVSIVAIPMAAGLSVMLFREARK
ncbi:MAG: hypothetical protein ACRETO_11225 [Gammaproteobacteria bacterium]